MRDSYDAEKWRAAQIAAKLIGAQDRRGVKDALAGELTGAVSQSPNVDLFQNNPREAALLGERVAALAAQASAGRLRVVLAGESVARGFPYHPQFGCALALQKLLDLVTGPDEVEVIDLSQNGLTYAGLASLVESAMALKPDAFVVFAGNNWRVPAGVRVDHIAEVL